MEQLDIEARGSAERKCRPVSLRKFSLAICLLEAAVICIFIYLLLNSGRIEQQPMASSQPLKSELNWSYRIYSHAGRRIALLPELIHSCNLRKHDLKHGVKCESREWFACSPVEQHDNTGQSVEPSSASEQPLATVISTSKSGRRLHREQVPLSRIECKPHLDAQLDPCRFSTRIIVNLQQRQQQILGWGGALTDSSAQNILSLTTNGTKRLLDDYFGRNGLSFNMIRITIGGSDFSSRFYTNDDSLDDDLGLTKFELREEDRLYKIPLLKLIRTNYAGQWRDAGSLKLFASMWSPPTWMKTNGHFNQGFLKGSIDAEHRTEPPDNELYFNALAELKAKFMLAYQRETGLKFWGLTVMNEPLFAVQPFLNFNTMIFPQSDYANYVAKYLGPKMRRNQELKHVKLIAHDDNRRYITNYTMPILANPDSKQYLDGVAVHSYADESYEQLDLVYDKYHNSAASDFFVLPTELCSGHLPFMEKALVGNWHRGAHYALDIIRSLQHSAAGWVDWNMVLDTEGGPGWLGGRLDAPIIVDKRRDMYYKSPMFYVLGQFSRHIPPGSIKLQTKIYNNNYDYQLETVTFALPRNEQLATVVVNNNYYPIELKMKIVVDDQLSNTYYSLTCRADSVSTIIYPIKL